MDHNLQEFIENWPLFKDRIVLFLGAGASYGAVGRNGQTLPNGFELRNHMWRDLKYSGPAGGFDPSELKLMPLEHAAAIIEAKTGRPDITKYLTTQFTCDVPLWQHTASAHLNPKAVLTTNYDELIELGYKTHHALTDVICDDREPTLNHVPIYKPHGSLSHSSQPIGKGGLVITQFDYFEFIDRYRGMLQNAMSGFNAACVVAVGYSFSDMDIGAELFRIRKSMKGTKWYAVFPRADDHVKKMYSKELGIEQIDSSFEDFLKVLDDHVNFLPNHLKYSNFATLQADGVVQ